MGLISRVSSRTYREDSTDFWGLEQKMLPNLLRTRLAHVRHLSGSIPKYAAAPPGYFNQYLPRDEMPGPMPAGPMTPEIRANPAAKYNMRAEDYKPCAWNPDYVQYGDYPQLNYQNAA